MTPNDKIISEIINWIKQRGEEKPNALQVAAELVARGITDLDDVSTMMRLIDRQLKRDTQKELDWPLISRVEHYDTKNNGRVIGQIFQYGRPNNPHYRWAYSSLIDDSFAYVTTRRMACQKLEEIDAKENG